MAKPTLDPKARVEVTYSVTLPVDDMFSQKLDRQPSPGPAAPPKADAPKAAPLEFLSELARESQRPDKAEMVSPSIRLTVNELALLRHVALARAGTGKVSVSGV